MDTPMRPILTVFERFLDVRQLWLLTMQMKGGWYVQAAMRLVWERHSKRQTNFSLLVSLFHTKRLPSHLQFVSAAPSAEDACPSRIFCRKGKMHSTAIRRQRLGDLPHLPLLHFVVHSICSTQKWQAQQPWRPPIWWMCRRKRSKGNSMIKVRTLFNKFYVLRRVSHGEDAIREVELKLSLSPDVYDKELQISDY